MPNSLVEPYCKKGYEDVKIGVISYEKIMAQCIVDSVPPVNRFFWTYNTSEGVFPVQGAKMQNKGNVSLLHFPGDSNDVTSLQCWAENDVGKQQSPCYFRILPAEPPESPKACLIRNASRGGVEVSCIAGNDGGLHQSFVLEVNDISGPAPPGIQSSTLNDQGEGESPSYRVLGDRPLFRLLNLRPNREYQAVVYAENARGRSDPPVQLPFIQVKQESSSSEELLKDGSQVYEISNIPNSKKTLGSQTNQNLTILISGVSAAAVLLILAIIIAATVNACRKSPSRAAPVRRRERRSSKPPSELELSEAGFGEGFHRRSAFYRASMYGECEERISRLIEGVSLFKPTAAMTRGMRLEKKVKEAIEKKKIKVKFSDAGIKLSPKYVIFGASPDAICDDYVVEIKCPQSEKTVVNYLTKEKKITSKYKAQIQLQMFMFEKKKCLFCVADSNFENNLKFYHVWEEFDREYINFLMDAAECFWRDNIFVHLYNSVKINK
ncbi:unnamed protein product [Ceutorhynchus assimilis]|uniref:YqaJ viral recombinase domain-containing protein n=1 Tax=Ceutorhynchus assimilis TaxID=467358 RepID=A0A9N9MS20_9CUCU|nr:unnamed protein product [Ceutorhynchus assimilis]